MRWKWDAKGRPAEVGWNIQNVLYTLIKKNCHEDYSSWQLFHIAIKQITFKDVLDEFPDCVSFRFHFSYPSFFH